MIDRVFRQRPHRAILRKVRGDARPSLATIVGAQHIRLEVGILVVFESGVDEFVVIARSHNAAHVCVRRHAREAVDLGPMRAVIFRDLDQAIVSAGVQETSLHRRFREHGDISVKRGGDVLVD